MYYRVYTVDMDENKNPLIDTGGLNYVVLERDTTNNRATVVVVNTVDDFTNVTGTNLTDITDTYTLPSDFDVVIVDENGVITDAIDTSKIGTSIE